MPARWQIAIAHPDPASVAPHHLHAVVSRWLDGDGFDGCDGHRISPKPYALVPLFESERIPVFEVGSLDPAVDERLARGVAMLHRRGGRLGRDGCRALWDSPRLIETAAWLDLVPTTRAAAVHLEFLTPTTFR